MPEDLRQKRVAEYLSKQDLVAEENIAAAIQAASETNQDICDVFIQKKWITKSEMLKILEEIYGVPSIDLTQVELDKESPFIFPKDLAMQYQAVCVSGSEDALEVAIADPFNVLIIDDLRNILGKKIKPASALESDLKETLNKLYKDQSANKIKDLIEEGMEDEGGLSIVDDSTESENFDELMKHAKETPIVKITQLIFVEAVKRSASDILVEPLENEMRVRYRIDGILHETKKMPKNLHASIISRIKIVSNLNIAEHRRPQDGRFRLKVRDREVDFRVSIVPSSMGEKVAIRILDQKASTLDIKKLGFEKEDMDTLIEYSQHPHGMILVCGPTGSGKTTTLYSVLKMVDEPSDNLVTVEDPIEFEIYGINQVAVNPDVKLTFASALRSILRQDPDTILIGEIRDFETLDVAIKAALTGHLVLSTLHTTSAPGSITRLVNMGIEPFLICSSVLMVAAQRLVRKICSDCKHPRTLEAEICKRYSIPHDGNGVSVFEGKGCASCFDTGYAGRACLLEILSVDEEIRKLIINEADEATVKAAARKRGMKTLRDDGIRKMMSGVTTLEEVLRVTMGDQELDI